MKLVPNIAVLEPFDNLSVYYNGTYHGFPTNSGENMEKWNREGRPAEERHATRATANRPMLALKAAHAADRTIIERIAARLITIVSSTSFLAAHVAWFTLWVMWNTGVIGVHVIDPFPFGLLTMIVSLEAIFLSILVLIGQSREATISELREELSFQVNLRMEAEVTKNLQLVAGLYTRMGFRYSEDDELREMLKTLDPEQMERDLSQQIKDLSDRSRSKW
jgi:uncharacterized membrane protein